MSEYLDDIAFPEAACRHCGGRIWEIRGMLSNGQEKFPFVCSKCEKPGGLYAPKKKVLKSGLCIQWMAPTTGQHKCDVCGAAGAEEHHWAPYALFGEESERWPKAYLCPKHHAYWHKIVTPNKPIRD